ncbi:two-component system response regulator FlrC [Rhodovulum bhavnagarense]|uniref:Nif-specific regulatory protein n=1 Tax=Rhodovulum bhavnagarense TaxID=992286 RepID=A0A4V2SW75_9RHOB|nr:sigma 54-interacting transcriptional regulator [Rhodovulum bhavnagarense]TCP61376.1 two-component system response regulator FlrC [Rhodovulum bhavnagarense]
MSDILLLSPNFVRADGLADLLTRRRCACTVVDRIEDRKAAILVCAQAQEAALGARELVEAARSTGARQLVIVGDSPLDAGPAPRITTELGGRLVRVGLPAPALVPHMLRDGGLMMLADMLAAQIQPMVAAAAQTGRLIDMASRVARTDVTVFINGPTGTGKEVLGRLIHAHSPRAEAPFIAINCAAIPGNMLEAMLFGHEKGAFTGASAANKGLIRAAEGGTLMLDEVTEMSLELQAKLLRVLQEKTVTPLGAQKEQKVDIRVVATSNRDMMEAVREGSFREDLYYRLNVFPLSTQALRQRREDIPALAAAMVRRHCPEGVPLPALMPDAIDTLVSHDWPGNVRELENVIQRALVLHDNGQIRADDIMIVGYDGLEMHPGAALGALNAQAA